MADREGAEGAAETPSLDVSGAMVLNMGGAEYTLRPSYRAIEAIEAQLGRSTFELANIAARGLLPLRDMGVIAAEMMRAHGRAMKEGEPGRSDHIAAKPERLSELIYETGAPMVCARLMVVLTGAVNGGYTAEGEAKAPATGKTGPPAGA